MIFKKRAFTVVVSSTFLFLFLFSLFVPLPAISANAASPSTPVSFLPTQNISNNSATATNPEVAAINQYVYVIWLNGGRLNVRVSNNFGASGSWSPAVQISKAVAKDPQIAIVGKYVYLAWITHNAVDFSVSSNNGATFTKPENVSGGTTLNNSPIIAAAQSDVYITWVTDGVSSTQQSEVFFVRNNNNGAGSFSSPYLLGNQVGSHEEDMTAEQGTDTVYVVWNSAGVSGEQILFASSANGGASFGSTQQLNPGFTARSREPVIVSSGLNVYVSFTSSNSGKYEAYVSVSQNQGGSFKLHQLTTNFKGARELQVSANGADAYVTFRGQDTTSSANQYVVVSTDDGSNFGSPINLASTQKGGQVGFGGVLASGSNAYALWPHTNSTGVTQMWFQSSQDSGARWAGAQQVSPEFGAATGMNDPGDGGPTIAASGAHVYIVWEQHDAAGVNQVYFRGS